MRSSFPKRYLIYMAGRTTRLLLGMLPELFRIQGDSIEKIVFVIGDLAHYRWAKEQTVDPRVHLEYQHEHLDPFRRPSQLNMRALARFEERYGAPNLWRYIEAQRIIDGLPYERKLRYLQTYLEYFDRLWERHQPDAFISGTPDSLPFLMVEEVFKRNGSLPLILIPSRIPGAFHVVDNEMEQIPFLKESYQEMSRQGLTDQERARAESTRNAYRVERRRPSYFGRGSQVRAMPSPGHLLKTYAKRMSSQDDYFRLPLRDEIPNSLKIRARWPLQAYQVKRLAVTLPKGERFFYYPLHYEPEFSIDILGGFRDQLQLIERICSALPADHRLYIKEHPNMFIGKRPLGFFKRLAKISKVRIIDPRTDGYSLISECRGIATIAGTTAFEGLFYGKPTILFGRAFYEVFSEGVHRAGSYESTVKAFSEAADRDGFSQEKLDQFVAALHQRSYEGRFEFTIPGIEEPDNLAALAQGVASELKFRMEKGLDAAAVPA